MVWVNATIVITVATCAFALSTTPTPTPPGAEQARIRPTLLEQTDVQGLRFDFAGRNARATSNQGARNVLLPSPRQGLSVGSGGDSVSQSPQPSQLPMLRPTLTLSRRPLIPARTDAVPLVDLRPLGS